MNSKLEYGGKEKPLSQIPANPLFQYTPTVDDTRTNLIINDKSTDKLTKRVPMKKAECRIVVRNIEDRWHINHPINQAIRLINQFAIEAFLKQNQNFFIHKRRESTNKTSNIPFSNASNQPPLMLSPSALITQASCLDMKIVY